MTGYPIELGSILFTIVEPHRGHEVAYNRWYERDHFYAGCLVGPGILAGKRWVATRPYKDLRYPTPSEITGGEAARGSYLATYWIERSQQDEWGTWAAKEVHRLHAQGRMFEHRDHVHTKMYRYRGGAFRDPDGVPPELALDRAYAGLVAVFVETTEEAERAAAMERYRALASEAIGGTPAAMCLSFTPVPIPESAPADIPRIPQEPRRFLNVYFLERDPADAWDALFAKHGDQVADAGIGRVLLAAPFIPVVMGTDVYADRLWE